MWFLKLPNQNILEQYKKDMLDSLYLRIDNCGISQIKKVLIPNPQNTSILEQLLISGPEAHYRLNKILMQNIVNGYNENDFEEYLRIKNLDDNLLNKVQIAIKARYSILPQILSIFDYQNQISTNKSRSYKLAKNKSVNVCPYCGRQYIFTVLRLDSNGSNNNQRISRPEFDHWFSKELYPLLSLNWYNLIPSCHTCNSSCKGNKIFSLDTHLHPYLIEQNTEFNFRSRIKSTGDYGVQITNVKNPKVEKMLEAFSIPDIYDYHGELEVKDIIELKKCYSKQQLDLIIYHLGKINPSLSYTDIYRMIFSSELEEAKELDRPLSKLKRDILIEIGVLTNKELP